MQTERRVIDIDKPRNKIYEYLKDPRNYLGGLKGIIVDSKGLSACVSGFGNIRADITNLVENEKVVMYSKDIDTSLTVKLQELSNQKTRVTLGVVSDPDCGFLKNIAIRLAIPKLLNTIVDTFKITKI